MTDKRSRKTKPEDFYLDGEKLEKGVRLPLRGRDGRLTKEWLQVRSIDSDGYQAEVTKALREAYKENPEEFKMTEREILKTFRHLFVVDWSFDDFSPERAKELLDNNKSIARAVIEVAGSSSLFFPDTGESSSPGPSAK